MPNRWKFNSSPEGGTPEAGHDPAARPQPPQAELQALRDMLRQESQRRQLAENELHRTRTTLEQEIERRTAQWAHAHQELAAQVRQQQQIADALRASEERYRTLIELAPDNITTLDCRGHITSTNAATAGLTGYTPAEVIGKPFWKVGVFRVRDLGKYLRIFVALIRGKPIPAFEMLCRCKDGSEQLLEARATVLQREGRVAGLQIISRNITAQRQGERLAAIGEMTAGLVHESRNTLQRSQACLEMLGLEVQDRPEALDLLARLQCAQDRLMHLYEEVHSYAAPIVLTRQPAELAAVIDAAWSSLEAERRGRDARLRTAAEAVPCQADRSALETVFRHILENALAACGDPVVVDVSWRRCTTHGRPAVEITLRDNGPGLTAQQEQRIFEPFYTTNTKGIGLGMAVSRRIVEAHGGHIVARSAPGHGAEILVTLPLQ